MIESSVQYDRFTGQVVWTMSPEVAEFYSGELMAVAGKDLGIRHDAEELLRAADKAKERRACT